jgi:hypothetical protein
MDMTHVSGFVGVYRYLFAGRAIAERIKLIKVAMLSDAKAIRLWLVRHNGLTRKQAGMVPWAQQRVVICWAGA